MTVLSPLMGMRELPDEWDEGKVPDGQVTEEEAPVAQG